MMLSKISGFARGLVRPFTTFALVLAFVYFTYLGKIDTKDFVDITKLVITFWFVDRAMRASGAKE